MTRLHRCLCALNPLSVLWACSALWATPPARGLNSSLQVDEVVEESVGDNELLFFKVK
jgi:hypothetical protein